MASENQPGAGGKGTAGYWGPSSDDAKEEAFENRYRQFIPVGVYKTKAHDSLHCKVCTSERQTLHYCQKAGIGFGPVPLVKYRENGYTFTKCSLCNEVLTRRHPGRRSLNL